ncbi:MAG: hypothetical protein LBE02_02440 [Spirochaetaceae bacterium]|jgi:hypothetical protein|nr:hypothetical protein [Spirochaetaceae bacterium]
MPQKTDLYSILNQYARKIESPVINMEVFIDFLGKYAKRVCTERPEWLPWAEETGARVWMDINHLVDGGRVILQNDETDNNIYLCYYYADLIKEAYKNGDKEADMPFPGERALKITIPPEQLRPLDISMELRGFLESPQTTALPIVKLIFPGNHGEALILAPMIPHSLIEFSLLKVRYYLMHPGNKEYTLHKLAPQLTGKEEYLREILDKIMTCPQDCLADLKKAREVAYYFWAHFCNLVKTSLNQREELLAEEQGVLQAVYIIEICSGFFKTKAAKAKELELAFKCFELEMEKPPYCFSREGIAKFKDHKGILLLDQYTQDGLDAYIRKRTTEPATPDELPDLLFFQAGDGTAWLVKKTKTLALCARLFAEFRTMAIRAISKRWRKLLKEFCREPAMDNDLEFERLINSYVEEYAPVLSALLRDRKLYLVYEEMRSSAKGIPESSRLFDRDELLPLRVLLMIKRRRLVSDVKLLMPFWYTLPILSNIIALFLGLGKKKRLKRRIAESERRTAPDDPLGELVNCAMKAEEELVPENHTLETYLEELIFRWGKLLNKQAKNNLVEDVNSLVRDRLRHMRRFQKNAAVNRDTLDKMTKSIIESASGLRNIGEQNALFLYIKLYLVKLLTSRSV